ncbi:MAG: bifunctional riboflavin kinase/FAD synthetase [Lachnospira sp.]|nr:bifunctional riboflavin kinase/FAD synthetase [Lachnospira sp.]
MQYIQGNSDFNLERASAVTLGKFDGVHMGHQKLISIIKEKAEKEQLLSVVFTFDKIPLSICPQKHQHFITTNTERRMFLEGMGLDVEVEYPFTKELMNTEPEKFIEEIIIDKLHAKYVVVGTDYRFGKERAGTPQMLLEKGPEYGFETIIVEKERYNDREISSTYVREELKLGHMETVNVLLDRPYSIYGVVSKGKQLGRQLNLPTMNIYPPDSKLLPPNGVYASVTCIDGQKYYGVTNLGVRPTLDDSPLLSVETNLFDYDSEAYGHYIDVQLMHFLRQEMKFDSVETLKKQMESDAAFAREMFML